MTAEGLCRGLCRHLAEAGWATLTEVTLATGRRVDILAVDRAGRILVVEVKSSVQDFRSDRKWQDYLGWCDRFAFGVGAGFPVELLPDGAGLFVADAYGAEPLRVAPEAPLAAARRKALLLRFAHVAAARLQRREDPPV